MSLGPRQRARRVAVATTPREAVLRAVQALVDVRLPIAPEVSIGRLPLTLAACPCVVDDRARARRTAARDLSPRTKDFRELRVLRVGARARRRRRRGPTNCGTPNRIPAYKARAWD